jgi:protein TonB
VQSRPDRDLERLIETRAVWTADDVDVRAELLQNSAPTKYPPSLYAEGTEGNVIAEFVVDSTGRVDPATIGIVAASHPLFAESVRLALRTAAYRPASRRGARVSQLVQQPFAFTVRK